MKKNVCKLFKTLKFIVKHPLNKKSRFQSFYRFVNWQLFNYFNDHTLIHKFVDNSRIIVKKGLAGATGNYYCGLDEFEDMAFLLHFLRPEDTFVDIGANVGSYTILASSCIGARTIAFEPVPTTYNELIDNINLNRIDSLVTSMNIGLGSKNGITKFTCNLDSMNHIALKNEKNTIDVKIRALDDIITPSDSFYLLKIDVEGFETEVINGGMCFVKNQNVKAIIIELNGLASRYGYNEEDIHNALIKVGFTPYYYYPFERKLEKKKENHHLNTIYIKDIDFVIDRIRNSRTFSIHNNKF